MPAVRRSRPRSVTVATDAPTADFTFSQLPPNVVAHDAVQLVDVVGGHRSHDRILLLGFRRWREQHAGVTVDISTVAAASYNVTLTITDSAGKIGRVTKTVAGAVTSSAVADSPRIEELKRRVQSDPASIAFAALAEEYRRAGRFEEAIDTCNAGLVRHPSYLSAHVTLGRALIDVGPAGGCEGGTRVRPETCAGESRGYPRSRRDPRPAWRGGPRACPRRRHPSHRPLPR